MTVRRLGAAGLALITVATGIATLAGPATAGTSAGDAGALLPCKIQGQRSGWYVFETPDENSARIGFVYQYTFPFGCETTEGVTYNVCGGGTTYYVVAVDGQTGYTPKPCFRETT